MCVTASLLDTNTPFRKNIPRQPQSRRYCAGERDKAIMGTFVRESHSETRTGVG